MLTLTRSLLAAALLTLGVASHADPVLYEITATGSGSLNGTAFTNTLFHITATADTNDAGALIPGIFVVANTTTTVSITGFNDALFTDTIYTFDNQSGSVVGFADFAASNDILDESNPAFASYDLTTSLGPLSGSPGGSTGINFGTTGGDFILDSISGDVTFQATVNPAAASVPEPAFYAMSSLLALSGGGLLLRRRKSCA